METLEIKTIGDYTIKIYPDEDSDTNPREWDNLGTMYCYHGRYSLGDEKASELYNPDDYGGWEEFYNELKKDGHVVILPLGLYDHSGITMYIGSSHDKWDGGGVGFIAVKAETIRKEYEVKRISKKLLAKVKTRLENEVKTYDDYLRGNVYGYEIEDKNGNHVDSCWGYLGDMKYCMDEAVGMAKYCIEADRKKRIEQVKTWVKNSVPLYARI